MPDDDSPRESVHKNPDAERAPADSESSGRGRGIPDRSEATHEGVPPAAASDAIEEVVVAKFPGSVLHDSHGQSVVYVDRAAWHDVALHLRDAERFTQCLDVTVVDHLHDEMRLDVPGVTPERFEVVANFLSHPRNRRIRTICEVPADDTSVASLADVYAGVDFAEREAYDLFGVTFAGHPDLTRILMPDDWVGHPLRKDDAPARIPVTFKEDPAAR
jgi:NADH:ubiquinone oxidoreductase subunit C